MIIPNCRTDESYNQKYLTGNDKEFVRGYDCAKMVVDNFFNNLNVYFDIDSFVMHFMNTNVPEELEEEYEVEHSFGNINPEIRDVKTYGDLIRSNLLDWIEKDRDELITSMIDGMDAEEYAKARENAVQEETNND